MKIYVASSWRNDYQPHVVGRLRGAGHEVYDFRHDGVSFHWREVDVGWGEWRARDMIRLLDHRLCERAFHADIDALDEAQVVVLVQPCGISAHLELGYAVGAQKHTAVLLNQGQPELMYKMADRLFTDIGDLMVWLETLS